MSRIVSRSGLIHSSCSRNRSTDVWFTMYSPIDCILSSLSKVPKDAGDPQTLSDTNVSSLSSPGVGMAGLTTTKLTTRALMMTAQHSNITNTIRSLLCLPTQVAVSWSSPPWLSSSGSLSPSSLPMIYLLGRYTMYHKIGSLTCNPHSPDPTHITSH